MAIRRVTGAVSPSELIFADANALGATYDGTGTTIERGETFTLPAAGTTAVSNGALRLEALKGDCTITNNGNSTLTNASGVDGTIVMRSGASDFPAFVKNSSLGSMSTPAREDFTGDVSGTVSGTINSNATIHDSLFKAGTGAFLARHTVSAWSVISDQSILPFNNASAGDSFDTDSNYNTTTYKYEVPVTGVYQFYYGIYTANTDSNNTFGFTTNNGEVDNQNEGGNFGTIQNTQDGDHIQFCLHILPLTSGDTVWVSARAESDYYSGHSYWGGCRLK